QRDNGTTGQRDNGTTGQRDNAAASQKARQAQTALPQRKDGADNRLVIPRRHGRDGFCRTQKDARRVMAGRLWRESAVYQNL
ncbi:hypothetical protein, partial [uncultured Bilophila sp.]